MVSACKQSIIIHESCFLSRIKSVVVDRAFALEFFYLFIFYFYKKTRFAEAASPDLAEAAMRLRWSGKLRLLHRQPQVSSTASLSADRDDSLSLEPTRNMN